MTAHDPASSPPPAQVGLDRVTGLDRSGRDRVAGLLVDVIAADRHRGVGAHVLELLATPGRVRAVLATAAGTRTAVLPGQADQASRPAGVLVGLAVGHPVGAGWEIELAVHPDRRHQRIGTALLRAALDDVPPDRVPHVWFYLPGVAHERLARRFGLTVNRRLLHLRGPTVTAVLPSMPPGIRLRGFRPDDRETLVRLHNSSFPDERITVGTVDERLARPFMGPDHLVIAEDADGLAGYAWMADPRPDGEGDGHGELVFLAVASDRAGRGLGTSLTTAGLRLLAERGVDRCMLYVDAANAPARRVYEATGFRLHHEDVAVVPAGTG